MSSSLDQEEVKNTQKEQKEQLKSAVSVLALELELHEGRRFNIAKGADEVAKVLKFSTQSDVQSVKDHLLQVVELLTPAQIQFFKKKGVELDTDTSVPSGESPEHQGKKKIVYRGQVKWV